MLGALLISAGVIGTQIGTKAGANLKGEQLRFLLAVLVLVVCVRVAIGLFTHPDDLYSITALRPTGS